MKNKLNKTKYIILIVIIAISGYPIYTKIKPILLSDYSVCIKNGEIQTINPKTNTFTSNYKPKIKFSDTEISHVDNVKLKILNKKEISDIQVLLKSQRYYFPLDTICKNLGFTLNKSNNIYILKKDNKTIKLTDTNYTLNSNDINLRGNLIYDKNKKIPFISVSDIENMFDLFAIFDSENNLITLADNKDCTYSGISIPSKSNKIAFFRFEDFTCGDTNYDCKNQAKVKCMVNLLYKNGIKFHTGWIPRFVAPEDNIDNDLLKNNNMINVGFIDVLDYMLNKGGEIGLHGYTHQSGNERSAVGEDLDANTNNSEEGTRYVVESGIDTASALNIPISFFESPHYRCSKLQKEYINQYFKYIYEPYDNNKSNLYSPNGTNIYIPTPLGYVPDPDDISSIEKGLESNDPQKLNSFFYHPSVELDFIHYEISSEGKLGYNFDDRSPIKRIVKLLNDNNYVTIHVTDLN